MSSSDLHKRINRRLSESKDVYLIGTSCAHRYQLGLTSQEPWLWFSLCVSLSPITPQLNLIFSPELNPSVSLRISQIFILHIIWVAQHAFPVECSFLYPFLSSFVCLGKWLLLNCWHDFLLFVVAFLLSDCYTQCDHSSGRSDTFLLSCSLNRLNLLWFRLNIKGFWCMSVCLLLSITIILWICHRAP